MKQQVTTDRITSDELATMTMWNWMQLHMNKTERQKFTDLLVIMELTIATLYAQVFLMSHQIL